jgi:ADP-heptose:LPS heptosyltransferase
MAALRRNILLFHQGALGDFVLTWPVAMALARIHPQSRIFYITHARKGKLAERAIGVESVVADAGWHALLGDAATPLPDLPAKLLDGAHSVVSFLSAPDGPFVENVRRRLAAEGNALVVQPNPPDGFEGHATEFQLQQLKPWPAAQAAAEQILRSIRARGVGATRPASPAGVIVHPGSGSPAKNWPAERFLELIARLRGNGESVRVLMGEVEDERWPKELIARFADAATIIRPQSDVELMNELLAARAFIGNDSGPGHLSGILGVASLVLFGPTSPARWKPLGPHVSVLHAEPLDSLTVEQVIRAFSML